MTNKKNMNHFDDEQLIVVKSTDCSRGNIDRGHHDHDLNDSISPDLCDTITLAPVELDLSSSSSPHHAHNHSLSSSPSSTVIPSQPQQDEEEESNHDLSNQITDYSLLGDGLGPTLEELVSDHFRSSTRSHLQRIVRQNRLDIDDDVVVEEDEDEVESNRLVVHFTAQNIVPTTEKPSSSQILTDDTIALTGDMVQNGSLSSSEIFANSSNSNIIGNSNNYSNAVMRLLDKVQTMATIENSSKISSDSVLISTSTAPISSTTTSSSSVMSTNTVAATAAVGRSNILIMPLIVLQPSGSTPVVGVSPITTGPISGVAATNQHNRHHNGLRLAAAVSSSGGLATSVIGTAQFPTSLTTVPGTGLTLLNASTTGNGATSIPISLSSLLQQVEQVQQHHQQKQQQSSQHQQNQPPSSLTPLATNLIQQLQSHSSSEHLLLQQLSFPTLTPSSNSNSNNNTSTNNGGGRVVNRSKHRQQQQQHHRALVGTENNDNNNNTAAVASRFCSISIDPLPVVEEEEEDDDCNDHQSVRSVPGSLATTGADSALQCTITTAIANTINIITTSSSTSQSNISTGEGVRSTTTEFDNSIHHQPTPSPPPTSAACCCSSTGGEEAQVVSETEDDSCEPCDLVNGPSTCLDSDDQLSLLPSEEIVREIAIAASRVDSPVCTFFVSDCESIFIIIIIY